MHDRHAAVRHHSQTQCGTRSPRRAAPTPSQQIGPRSGRRGSFAIATRQYRLPTTAMLPWRRHRRCSTLRSYPSSMILAAGYVGCWCFQTRCVSTGTKCSAPRSRQSPHSPPLSGLGGFSASCRTSGVRRDRRRGRGCSGELRRCRAGVRPSASSTRRSPSPRTAVGTAAPAGRSAPSSTSLT